MTTSDQHNNILQRKWCFDTNFCLPHFLSGNSRLSLMFLCMTIGVMRWFVLSQHTNKSLLSMSLSVTATRISWNISPQMYNLNYIINYQMSQYSYYYWFHNTDFIIENVILHLKKKLGTMWLYCCMPVTSLALIQCLIQTPTMNARTDDARDVTGVNSS